MKSLFNYFLRGLLILFPAFATFYLVIAAVRWTDRLLGDLLVSQLGLAIPGLGALTVFLGIALIGYILSRAFIRPLTALFDRLLSRVPFIKIVYTSLKELTEAFVGEKKKFNRPVMVEFPNSGTKRIGFLTRENMEELDLPGTVAVYCPHSYNFSGNLYLVPREHVRQLEINASDAMRFAVSAGATDLQ